MASSYSFAVFPTAEILEWLQTYRIAPSDSLRVQDLLNPQPGFVAEVLARFLAAYVCDEADEQLQFRTLQALDNPDHHMRALRYSWTYKRANAFLKSIQFRDLKFQDLLRADGPRVAYILSALINYLLFREERLTELQPIIEEYAAHEERRGVLMAKIAELRKAKEDHLLKEQEEEPMVQQQEQEVNALKERLHEYNREQQSLRLAAKTLDEKKEETLRKINQVDFQLMKAMQEKQKLSAKIVHSPEKLQRNLEEKKAVRDELMNLEKMVIHKVQEKTNTLEMYTKVSEKLAKHHSKISAVIEKSAAAKASEKDVKAKKEKISDQNLEIQALRSKAAQWQLKVLENEAKLKAKEKERDEKVGENNRKMTSLKSEVESEYKCLEEKEIKIKEKVEKGSELCSQAVSVAEAAKKKTDEIYGRYNQVCEVATIYLDGVDQSFDETDEAAVTLNTRAQTGA